MNVNRRRFLRGLGVTMALPALESLLPRALASVTAPNALATTPTGAPLRMAFMYFPNGDYPDHGYGGSIERVAGWAYVHE